MGLKYSLVPPVNKRVFSSAQVAELRAQMGADVKIVLTRLIPPHIIILWGPMSQQGVKHYNKIQKII